MLIKSAKINLIFVLYFFNKYLLNRYQITPEEIKSLFIYSLIYIFLLNLANLLVYFFISKNETVIFVSSLCIFFFLFYGNITYFFYFNNFEIIMRLPNYSFFTYMTFLLVLCVAVYKFRLDTQINALLLFYSLFILLINFPINSEGSVYQDTERSSLKNLEFNEKPDIYFVVLDGYPNLDIAKKYYSYDVQKVYSLFNENNIEVFGSSTTPYNRTINTLSSLFEMEYLFLPPSMAFSERENITAGFENSNSLFEKILRHNGYQLVKYGSKAFCSTSDICLNDQFSSLNTKNTVYFDLMLETPLKIFIEKEWIDTKYFSVLGCSDNCIESSIDASIVEITKSFNSVNRPIFAFIHLVNSHDPYILNSKCEISDTPSYKLAKDDPEQFNENLDCTYSEMEKLIDLLNLNEDILIIQSDHGPQYEVMKNVVGKNVETFNEDQLLNRFKTISASNINNFCANKTKDFSSINTFRVVINCLTNEDLAMRKERSFIIFGSANTSIYEITNQLEEAER